MAISHFSFPSLHLPSDHAEDPFTTAQANGWNWRDANVGFYKTQTDEEIRKKWEEVMGDLARGWKRRWRDAVKEEAGMKKPPATYK
jgi:hypothetical protein